MSDIRTKPVTKEYEEGFDRAFKAPFSHKGGRWRWEEGQLVPAGEEPTPQRLPVVGDSHYDGLRATDGTPIDSRRKHREYMRDHGLAMADDFKETWASAEKERAAGSAKERRERRDLVGKTLYEQEMRRR